MPASSGRPNCGCDETSKNKGPIPKGHYTLNNKQLSNPSALGDIVRNLRGDWGDWRVPLTPSPGTNTHGRSGFFLHGGRMLARLAALMWVAAYSVTLRLTNY
jgi:hypothetical protein